MLSVTLILALLTILVATDGPAPQNLDDDRAIDRAPSRRGSQFMRSRVCTQRE
jgi:hypothetical protein